ncbi:MAG: PH domain-containing protein [Luteimonas sp.]|nr:PH domain-containing protein [Luteimonas sp.]
MTTPDLPEPPEPPAIAEAEARLPTDDERRLHPWSWLFVLVDGMKQFIVPLAALVFLGGRSEEGWQLAGAAVVIVLLALVAIWRYFTFRYRIDGDSLFVRSGIVQRELRQIPFSRIHNVALQQSLLHRLFGVAAVKLESAGGTKPEAEMKVLTLADALALERLIRHRGRVATGEGGSDAAQRTDDDTGEDGGDTLLALPTSEIVRLGLISNRGMVVVAGAFALVWQVYPEKRMFSVLSDLWREAFGYVGHFNGNWFATALTVVVFVLLVLALIRAFSVLLAIVRYHGFRLSEHGRRLTVERGLLTRVRASVPRRRIQSWTLRETALHRLFGRRSLDIDTAASQVDPNQEKSLRELAPVGTPEACDDLVRHVLRGAEWPPAGGWHPLHPKAWQRLLMGDVLFGVGLLAGGLWFFDAWGLLALLWLPWAWLVARRHAMRAGYAIDDGFIAVREGWWSRHWRFAEIDKIQAIELRRSPLDKRFGMASVWLDTAGAGAMSPPLRMRYLLLDDAQALFSRIERDVARRPLRW